MDEGSETATVDADVVRALLATLPVAVAMALPDGRVIAPEGRSPCATIVFRRSSAAARLLQTPSLLAFGEAFVAGDVDLEGDLVAALEAAYGADALLPRGASRAPAERLPDQDAVRHHYDLPREFYALFLDARLVYTCAYYRRPAATLEEAQAAKLDLVCRKLDLAAGARFLDLGCGWGALTAWAAERYGADALGVTLSLPQASAANETLRTGRLESRARVVHQDWREVDAGAVFDAVAAVGLIEHVGVANYDAFFATVHRLLRPGGRFLNHGITHATPGSHSTGMTFLTQHVFPGAEFERVGHVVSRLEAAGFRIVDVESLGAHYAVTTATWLARLRANRDAARRLVGERVYRTWIAYLAAATVAFRRGWIDLHQVLAERPGAGRATPIARERWYRHPPG